MKVISEETATKLSNEQLLEHCLSTSEENIERQFRRFPSSQSRDDIYRKCRANAHISQKELEARGYSLDGEQLHGVNDVLKNDYSIRLLERQLRCLSVIRTCALIFTGLVLGGIALSVIWAISVGSAIASVL